MKIVTCIHIYMAIVNNYVTLLDGSPRPIYHIDLLHLSSKANSNLKIEEGANRKRTTGPEDRPSSNHTLRMDERGYFARRLGIWFKFQQ